jgi:hypothetical protein
VRVTDGVQLAARPRFLPTTGSPRLGTMSRGVEFFKRTVRAVGIAATDSRIPRPLRWIAALGLAPIPGPFDEVLLLMVAVPLVMFYRRPLHEAWQHGLDGGRSAGRRHAPPG